MQVCSARSARISSRIFSQFSARAFTGLGVLAALLFAMLMPQPAAAEKVIKDQAEYNAYIAALNIADPGKKSAAMESFLKKFPNSVVKMDALEQTMAAYQAAGNAAQVEATAGRILALEPNHVRALAIVTFLERARATQGDNAALAHARAHSEQGIAALAQWRKPEGIADAEFVKLQQQMTAIFSGARGFVALQEKDYAKARDALLRATAADPSSMQDLFQLGIAELDTSPADPAGFRHLAKAIDLARAANNQAALESIAKYAKAKYRKYHGGDDGWDEIVANAAREKSVPAEFAAKLKAAPTPAELAVAAVAQYGPGELSFSDWEFILHHRDASPANRDAAEKVWNAIQTKQRNGAAKLKIPVKVLAITPDGIDAAITDENKEANRPDLHIVIVKPTAQNPVIGGETAVIGVLSSYRPDPFVFVMKDGEFATPGAGVGAAR